MNAPSREEVNARINVVDAHVEARSVSIESRIDARFAELTSLIHKGKANTIKWVAGIVVSVMALGLTVMSLMLN